jgi:hypothetical protein
VQVAVNAIFGIAQGLLGRFALNHRVDFNAKDGFGQIALQDKRKANSSLPAPQSTGQFPAFLC